MDPKIMWEDYIHRRRREGVPNEQIFGELLGMGARDGDVREMVFPPQKTAAQQLPMPPWVYGLMGLLCLFALGILALLGLETMAQCLFIIGWALSIFSGIWMLVAAFQVSAIWGMILLLTGWCGIPHLVFLITNFAQAWKPFALSVVAAMMIVLGFAISPEAVFNLIDPSGELHQRILDLKDKPVPSEDEVPNEDF